MTTRSLISLAVLLVLFARGRVVAQGPPASPVEAQVVEQREFTPSVVVLGTVEPRRRSVVAASIEGYVIDYPVVEGQRVREGDVLARLRDTILRLRIGEAEAALEEIVERHKNAQRDLERALKLVETDAVTQKAVDDRATAEKTLALQIPQAQARVEILKADVAKKIVKAPYAGQIVREHTQVGEWLTRGGAVISLVDVSSVFVRANVPERTVGFASEKSEVRAWVGSVKQKPYRGTVVSISNDGDAASRTFPVRVEFKNDGSLRAGMSARLELPAGDKQLALVVSKDAVLIQGRQSFVYVIGDGDLAERREVTTGASTGSKFAVLSGLTAGERVVIKGNERLRPGAPVRVVTSGRQDSTSD
jgi:membrane fusion protein (multidrug efflux system)